MVENEMDIQSRKLNAAFESRQPPPWAEDIEKPSPYPFSAKVLTPF